jgi:hypothetical protein
MSPLAVNSWNPIYVLHTANGKVASAAESLDRQDRQIEEDIDMRPLAVNNWNPIYVLHTANGKVASAAESLDRQTDR